jgi:hypothetical protein
LNKVKSLTVIMGLKTHKQTFRNLRTIQHVLSIGRTEVFMCGKSGSTRWFKLFGEGLSITDQPLFSIRNGHRKSIKIGKYYIYGT